MMIRLFISLACILALAIPADAAPRTQGQCNGDKCISNALLHPFQTIGNVVHHPQKLPEGPPAAPAAAVYSAPAATARQGRFHIFPIFQGRQARGSGGCGCGR